MLFKKSIFLLAGEEQYKAIVRQLKEFSKSTFHIINRDTLRVKPNAKHLPHTFSWYYKRCQGNRNRSSNF